MATEQKFKIIRVRGKFNFVGFRRVLTKIKRRNESLKYIAQLLIRILTSCTEALEVLTKSIIFKIIEKREGRSQTRGTFVAEQVHRS